MAKIDFETITRTCCACPSQWEGKLDDGKRMFYARFRHGHFYVEFSKEPANDVMDWISDESNLMYESDNEPGDGYMTDWHFYRILLRNNLLSANLPTRLTIRYLGGILSYLDERKMANDMRKGIERIRKYGLFGKPEDE